MIFPSPARAVLFGALWLTMSAPGAAQSPAPKTARAVRVDGAAPRIDGVLDDATWSRALAITDFVQKIPNEGGVPSVATEVKILYDDEALYVGARLRRGDGAIRTSV